MHVSDFGFEWITTDAQLNHDAGESSKRQPRQHVAIVFVGDFNGWWRKNGFASKDSRVCREFAKGRQHTGHGGVDIFNLTLN